MKTNEQENYNIFDDPDYLKADFQLKHLKMIRYRLMKGREAYNKIKSQKFGRKTTITQLHTANISISEQTYDSLFDPKSKRTSIDISAVVYICQLLNLSVDQVLAFPEETLVDQGNEPKFNKFESYFTVLNDENYNGTFYFYTLRYSGTDSSFYQQYPDALLKQEDFLEGTLTFEMQENSGSIAKLDYTQNYSKFDNTVEARKKSATCIPMLSTINNNVYLRFVDNDGRTYQIVFDRQEFYSGKCYFRIAGMFIETSEHEHYPIFQKMILLRKPLSSEYYDYIRGALNMNQNTLIISPNKLAELAEKDPEIQEFVKYFNQKIQSYKKELLVFDENIILSDNSALSTEIRKSILLKLRNHTFSQNQVWIGEDKYAHTIFKKLQQNAEQIDSNSNNQKES